MGQKPEKPISYEPSLWIRVACWFAIYVAASYVLFLGTSIKFKTLGDFWPCIPGLPSGLSFFIVGFLGLPPDDKYGLFFLFFAYGFYLIHFVLILSFRSQKIFWSLLAAFIFVVFITLCGAGSYSGPVFEEIPLQKTAESTS